MRTRDALFAMVPVFTLLGTVLILVLGWMYLMPRGTPDWLDAGPTETIHRVTDMGELAVRLGSAVTFDRPGNVVFVDTFDDGLRGWIPSAIGDGASVDLSTYAARTGACSVKLVTGKTFTMQAGLTKYQPRPVASKVGVEASFAPISADPEIHIRLYHYTGTGYFLFQVRYDYATEKLQYLDSAGAWQDLGTGLAFYPNYTSFNSLKVVADLADNEYVRILFNDGAYYPEGQGGYWVAGATAPYLSIYLAVVGDSLANYTVYLDDVVLTQNEP